MTNIPVQWGRNVMNVEHDSDGVTVNFENGTSARGDILIGADGINSVGKVSLLLAFASLTRALS
jgi:2-polyprenyl-6-methoxyphenol hydroxylase-like FAD-dependent oxidoreductase